MLKLLRSFLLSQHRNAAETKYPTLKISQVLLQCLKIGFLHGDDEEGLMCFPVMDNI
jgi:hypothetical protein